MRLGINHTVKHETAEEWADILYNHGLRACVFPLDYTAKDKDIEAYKKAANERDIIIGEVGIWNSPVSPDEEYAKKAYEKCKNSLILADYIGAKCCVNVSGAVGEIWNDCYAENYSKKTYDKNIELIQRLIDEVKPKNTYYALEIMQWMIPDSPEQYLQFIKDLNRERFAVHMDAVNLVKNPFIYTHLTEETERAFKLLGKYIKSCHLKDCLIESALSFIVHEVLPGKGIFNIERYTELINEVDFDMPVMLEHLSDDEEYFRAIKYIRDNFGDRLYK